MNIQITITVNRHNDYMASNLSNLLVDGIGFEMTEETMCERVLTMDYRQYRIASEDRMMAIELDGAMSSYITSYMSKLTTEIQ